jgi:hypothetical protein
MTARQESVTDELRIGADEVKARIQSGVPVTMLDVRNDRPWEESPVTIAGAVRVRPADWHIDPSWPKDRLTVVY